MCLCVMLRRYHETLIVDPKHVDVGPKYDCFMA
jgi:hypothetical protein